MTKLDFPDTPTTGQLYGSSGTMWRFDGTRWASTAGSSGARGAVAYAQVVVNQSGIATETNLTGMSVTWTADPSRIYRTTVRGELTATVAGDIPVVSIRTQTSASVQRYTQSLPSTAGTSVSVQVVESGLSGSQTRYASLQRAAGSGTFMFGGAPAFPAYILVEDITYEAGSSGTPVGDPPPAVYLSRSSNFSVASGVPAGISWTTSSGDTAGAIWKASAPTRMTVPKKGIYIASTSVRFEVNNSVGELDAWIRVNGTAARYASASAPNTTQVSTTLSCSTPLFLSPLDYVEIFVYQSSGGNMNVGCDNIIPAVTNGSLVYVGASPA